MIENNNKNILITSISSYIGTEFKKYLENKFSGKYNIKCITLQKENWRHESFSSYDTIFHTAGIAHSDNGKISEEKSKLYYKVNTDLTVEVLKKAILDKSKQFIFLSSAIIYGESGKVGCKKNITIDTLPSPINSYGDSKLQAEIGIVRLLKDINIDIKNLKYVNSDFDFSLKTMDFDNQYKSFEKIKVCVLRLPMVYGENAKGNYKMLCKIANNIPIFPYVNNERSMISTENLCKKIKMVVDNNLSGLYFPQDDYYHNTSLMVKNLSAKYNKKMLLLPGFQWLIKLFALFMPFLNKAFGNLTFDKSLNNIQ